MENLGNAAMLSKSTPIVCEECGCDQFEEIVLLRKLSKLLIGTQEDAIVPIPTFACKKCGHVNKDFMPKGFDENKD